MIAALATLLVCGYLVEVLLLWAEWVDLGMPIWTIPLRPEQRGGFVPSASILGDYVGLLCPVACLALWRLGHFGRLAAIMLAVAGTAAIIVVGTRALWLSSVMAAAIVGIVSARLTALNARRLVRFGAPMLGLVLALTIGLGVVDKSLRDLDEGRTSAYVSALEIARENVLVGAGPGTYGAERLSQPIDRMATYVLPSALNPLMTTVSETGLVGTLAVIIAIVFLASLVTPVLSSGRDRTTTLAALAGLIVVLTHAQVDTPLDVPGVALLVGVVYGLVIVHPRRRPAETQAFGLAVRLVAGTMLALAAVVVPSILRVESAARAYDEGVFALASGDVDLALRAAGSSLEAERGFVPAIQLSIVSRDRVGDRELALDLAVDAVHREDLPQHRLRLAILLERSGRISDAAGELRLAAERLPDDALILLNAADFHVRHRTGVDPVPLLARAFRAEPQLAGVQLPHELARYTEPAYELAWHSLRAEGLDRQAAALALWHGDMVAARAVAAGLDEMRDLVRAAAAAMQGNRDAALQVEALVEQAPTFDSVGIAWLVALKTCDLAAVDRWQRVTQIANAIDRQIAGNVVRLTNGQSEHQPPRYPRAIWGVIPLANPDVAGTLTWSNMSARGCP